MSEAMNVEEVVEKANKLYRKEKYKEAFEYFQKAADQGDIGAQNNLGALYKDGKGCNKNHAKAFEHFQKAADQGYAGAQYNIGVMYNNGEFIDQDYNKACEWYQKAADQGDSEAENILKTLLPVSELCVQTKKPPSSQSTLNTKNEEKKENKIFNKTKKFLVMIKNQAINLLNKAINLLPKIAIDVVITVIVGLILSIILKCIF